MENNKYKVNFNDLQENLGINDVNLFIRYLKEIFNDLSIKIQEKPNVIKIIEKNTFIDYLKAPLIFKEKLFKVFDIDKDGYLNQSEFVLGFKDLYTGYFLTVFDILSEILSFNNDNYIYREDVQLMLSYLPLIYENKKITYEQQTILLKEINEIINNSFEDNNKLSKDEFLKITKNKTSDIFLLIISNFYNNLPFNPKEFIYLNNFRGKNKNIITKNNKNKTTELFIIKSSNSFIKFLEVLIKDINLKKSKKIKNYSPNLFILKAKNINENDNLSKNTEYNLPRYDINLINEEDDINKKKRKHLLSVNLINKKNDKNDINESSHNKGKKLFSSLIKKTQNNLNNINIHCLKNTADKENNNNCSFLYENWIIKLEENINKLYKFYLCIGKNDLYYYNNSDKKELEGIHNLNKTYIKEKENKIIDGKTYYSFEITFRKKNRIYYTTEHEINQNFIKYIKEAENYRDIKDYYNIMEDIDKGQFGKVKKCENKNNAELFSVKIINKEKIRKTSEFLIKTELEVLKLVRHPNIVKFIDCFEDVENIYIITELILGGTLHNYLINNELTEKRIAMIMYQIGLGVQYLQNYGIIHRDIKTTNIMMTNEENMTQIKLIDFGLSIIKSPNEKSLEGSGNPLFSSPEIFLRSPYNNEIDIWSIGILLYYMVTGTFPFDDDSANEEKIAYKIVNTPIKFPENLFQNINKDIINIIKGCVNKNQEKRYNIYKFLNHKWFKILTQ